MKGDHHAHETFRDRVVRWVTTLQRLRLTGREQAAVRLLDALDDTELPQQDVEACGRQAQGPRGPWCLY